MGRKRVLKGSSIQSGEKEGMRAAKALFADVMQGSVNTAVDPRSCLPLTRIRGTSKSGVMRLKRIFRGADGKRGSATGPGDSVGFIAGSDMPITVPLQGALARYIVDYFRDEKGMADKDAREEAKSRDSWFGVVDGVHRLQAILDLIREEPESWDGFQWPVIMLKGGHSIQVLRQLARQQNRKLSEQYYVETTLYDQLSGLKKEAERLARERGKQPTSREVVAAYDGSGALMDTTMQQMASTAMRLSEHVLSVLGKIMNAEHPELIDVPQVVKSLVEEDNQAEVMSTVDCRVFRRFLNITSIKQATVFMRAGGEAGVHTQVNTLYRCRDICRATGFKSVPFRVVVEQFEKATLAMNECRKFEALIETEKWPISMETMRKNLLETSKFDEAISRNAGNDNDVLKDLVDQYLLVCPAVASVKIQKHRAMHQICEKEVVQEENSAEKAGLMLQPADTEFYPETPAPLDTASIHAGSDGREEEHLESGSYSGNLPAHTNGNSTVESDPIVTTERDDISAAAREVAAQTQASQRLEISGGSNDDNSLVLKSLHVNCHQMRWQEFDRNILSQEDSTFDLVLTDPPYGVPPNPAKAGTKYKNYVDDQEMKDFSQFCRRVLVPGGYVFLFTSAKYFYRWCEAFRGADFKVCDYPFILNKDTTGLQRTRLEDFPQCAAELSVMARAPGKTASSFKPDFESPISLFECSQKRRFSSVLNAPIPKNKLTDGTTRAPLLTEEKNPTVLAEIINTFCPEGGRVLDCYAGTCTTAIAALESARRCVCIEMNADIYRLALRRLFTIAPNYMNNSKRIALTRGDMTESGPVPSDTRSITKINDNLEHLAGDESDTTAKGTGICGGDKVVLILDEREVGFATVQSSTGELGGELVKTIHRLSLSEYEKEKEDLVVIMCVSIRPDCTNLAYIYSFPSQDDLPVKLGDMHRNGVYVWDRNKLTRL